MDILTIIVVLLIIGGLFVWSLYNSLVTVKVRIKASIQEIGNQLKRQADLIPNLVESVKGYMKHEAAIFDALTKARKSVADALASHNPQELIDASQKLQMAMAPIRVVLESTPELKAAEPTMKLMDEVRDTSDKVMYSRRTLIDLTADYNIKIATFPANIVAGILGFKAEAGLVSPEEGDQLKVSQEETKTPKVNLSS